VDNITGATSGDLYVAEDGGNMEINIITPQGMVAPTPTRDEWQLQRRDHL
jgi:hypothetical protein